MKTCPSSDRLHCSDTFPANEPCVYIYQEHIRLYFSSIKLQRLVAHSSSYVWGEVECDAVIVCFESATKLLKQVLILAEMQTLYYLWDTCHLMTAYSAMMLGRVSRPYSNLSKLPPWVAMDSNVGLKYSSIDCATCKLYP